VPIPGTKRIRFLDENLAATEIELRGKLLQRLDAVASVGRAVGDRNSTMEQLNL
jgi:aryl-alcohol dehydrogenase-like predicted oxidoreductase